MTTFPLISIITAVKNGAPFLRGLIESVLNQDYPHYEHLVIDDGSDDEGATRRILESYPHLRWWSRENRGQYASQNEAMSVARGDIIGVISADDAYVIPGTFAKVARYFQTHPRSGLVYGKTLHMDSGGRLLPYQLDLTGRHAQRFLRYYLFIQHSSLFVARRTVAEHGVAFDPSYKYTGDWDWIIRLAQASDEIGYLPEYLSVLRMHPAQASRTAHLVELRRERQRVCREHGSSYAIHMLLRRAVGYRAVSGKALVVLRTQGVRGLAAAGREWASRRRTGHVDAQALVDPPQ